MGDYRTTTGEDHPLPEKDARRRRRRMLLSLGGGIAVIIMIGFVVRLPQTVAVNGHVTTINFAEVRPVVAGRIAEIYAASGQKVESGALLARLESQAQQEALEEALSQVRKIEAQREHTRAEIAENRRVLSDQIVMAELRLRNAESKRERTRELLAKGLASGAALEDDTLRTELASVELRSLTNQDLTLGDRTMAILDHELAAGKDAANRIAAELHSREIHAPITGLVVRYEFVVGELVRPDNVLFEIYGGDRLILKLRVPERFSTRVAAGQAYKAILASYAGLRRVVFRGRIEAMRDVIQSSGALAYRTAYASFDPNGHLVPPGTTVEADIYYGSACFWVWLFGLY